tara:strand:+ start:81 stop:668 length:588 start_codon:yes stop_codon:yes gene_type:complete
MAQKQSMRAKVLADFADNVVRLSKINLGKTYTATNARGKKYKKRIDNSGNLRNSIEAKVKQRNDENGRFEKANIVWSMLSYGEVVDKGQPAGKDTSAAGQLGIEKWIRSKPLRIRDYRDGKKGRFLKTTDARVKGLAYVIARSHKRYGIPATNFFTDAFESQEEKYYNEMQEAIAADQIEYIESQIDNINDANKS